jgi:pimeloyl-ACP methyl ester carboxylesterase
VLLLPASLIEPLWVEFAALIGSAERPEFSSTHSWGCQLLAIYASGDRTAMLARVTAPALVVHGDADPLTQVPGGQAIAAALPDAELLVFPGVGHGPLPHGIWPRLVAAISRLVDRAEILHH